MTLDPQPFEPRRLLEQLESMLAAQLVGRAIALQLELDPSLPDWLLGDARRLQQILFSLGSNALKFTANGEVRVELRLLDRPASQARVEFMVSDTGIGIAPVHRQPLVAGPAHADASDIGAEGGARTGLAISRSLLHLMGSDLAVESCLGVGSRFSFVLDLPVLSEDQVLPELCLAGLEPGIETLPDQHLDVKPPVPATTALPQERIDALLAEGIDLPGALRRMMGKPELLARMLRNFYGGARALPAQLHRQQRREAGATLHGFKGLSATLGLRVLAELAREGEERLEHHEELEAGWMDRLEASIGRCLVLTEQLAADLAPEPQSSSNSVALDVAAAVQDLRELAGLLDNADMAALDALEALRSRHGAGLSLEALDEAMAGLEFELARQRCEQIIGELRA